MSNSVDVFLDHIIGCLKSGADKEEVIKALIAVGSCNYEQVVKRLVYAYEGNTSKAGRPATYIYPEIEVGKIVELELADVCRNVSEGKIRSARTAILNAAKRQNHVLHTEVISVIDYGQPNNRRELLRITRVA